MKEMWIKFLKHGKFTNNWCSCVCVLVSLIGVDIGNTTTRISRFANYLRNLLPSNDVGVMEMAAQAVGLLALTSGTYVAEYVEFEVKRALEWLTGDRHEGRRHAAVSHGMKDKLVAIMLFSD